MRNKSIRYYFFTSITTVLVASVLVMGMVQTYVVTTYFRMEKEKQIRDISLAIAQSVKDGEQQIADSALESIHYMAEISNALVFFTTADGEVLFGVGEGAPENGQIMDDKILENIQLNRELRESGDLGGLFATSHYTSGIQLTDGAGATLGYVFVSSDSSFMNVDISETMSTFVMSAGVVLLVSSLLALALTNRTVIPIRKVADAARRFGEGDYSARVPVEGDDELAQLAITFNEMANSFEATDTSRRSFMGNIAHELRTPMTTIKGFIDGMLDGTIPLDQRDKYLAVVSDEVGRLARLTKNMLDVSRLEAGEYTPNIVSFDILSTATNVFISAEQRLEEKNLSVKGLDLQKPTMVMGDQDFVHQILFNLVDNAIKFSKANSEIEIHVETSKGMVVTSVKNTGGSIAPESMAYVFDRFYKGDKSRGVNTKGAGLGLHISKVLVGMMGGRIWVDCQQDEWTRFSFTLPASTAKWQPKKASPKNHNRPQ